MLDISAVLRTGDRLTPASRGETFIACLLSVPRDQDPLSSAPRSPGPLTRPLRRVSPARVTTRVSARLCSVRAFSKVRAQN